MIVCYLYSSLRSRAILGFACYQSLQYVPFCLSPKPTSSLVCRRKPSLVLRVIRAYCNSAGELPAGRSFLATIAYDSLVETAGSAVVTKHTKSCDHMSHVNQPSRHAVCASLHDFLLIDCWWIVHSRCGSTANDHSFFLPRFVTTIAYQETHRESNTLPLLRSSWSG